MFFLESPSPLLVIKQINIYDRNRCSKSLMYDYHDRYGKYIPELVPGSHCGYNELQRIATGLAMQKHRQLITRLTEKCRMVTNGLKTVWLPDPAVLKSDGFSSGIKSMEPHVLKVFLNPTSWSCNHELFRLVPSYGSFEYDDNLTSEAKQGRDYGTLLYTLSTIRFIQTVIYLL